MSQLTQTGSINKEDASEPVIFDHAYALPPVVLISPFYKGSATGVGYVPTITEITQQGFTVTGQNMAPNYYVNWLAVGQPLNK